MKCIREHGCGSAGKTLLQVEAGATASSACHMAEESISHALASVNWTAETREELTGICSININRSVSLQVKPFRRPVTYWDSTRWRHAYIDCTGVLYFQTVPVRLVCNVVLVIAKKKRKSTKLGAQMILLFPFE